MYAVYEPLIPCTVLVISVKLSLTLRAPLIKHLLHKGLGDYIPVDFLNSLSQRSVHVLFFLEAEYQLIQSGILHLVRIFSILFLKKLSKNIIFKHLCFGIIAKPEARVNIKSLIILLYESLAKGMNCRDICSGKKHSLTLKLLIVRLSRHSFYECLCNLCLHSACGSICKRHYYDIIETYITVLVGNHINYAFYHNCGFSASRSCRDKYAFASVIYDFFLICTPFHNQLSP